MKNSKLRRILLTLACAVLLVSLSVGATLAYLTSTTGVVENTFTVGKVQIDLDEAKVNEYGVEDTSADRVTENEYKLIPNHTYVKDPEVHVLEGSEPCYVFVKIENGMAAYLVDKCIEDQLTANRWKALDGVDGVYYYEDVVDALDAQQDLHVFDTITLKADLDDTKIAEAATKEITVQAYAVQADGFATAAAAYAAAPCDWDAE